MSFSCCFFFRLCSILRSHRAILFFAFFERAGSGEAAAIAVAASVDAAPGGAHVPDAASSDEALVATPAVTGSGLLLSESWIFLSSSSLSLVDMLKATAPRSPPHVAGGWLLLVVRLARKVQFSTRTTPTLALKVEPVLDFLMKDRRTFRWRARGSKLGCRCVSRSGLVLAFVAVVTPCKLVGDEMSYEA
jgi:hypothetical protein